MAHQPSKYNNQYEFGVCPGVRCAVRFDKPRKSVTRFIVQLQRLIGVAENHWKTFAQIDHEPRNPGGHDLYSEGLHVDIYHTDGTISTIQSIPTAQSLPRPTIVLLHRCKDYLCDYVDYFRQVAKNQTPLNSPPKFS